MLQYAFLVVLVNNAVTTSKNLSLCFKNNRNNNNIVLCRTNAEEGFVGETLDTPHVKHGEEKATSPHRRNGSEDPGVPGIESSAPGVSEVRPGL